LRGRSPRGPQPVAVTAVPMGGGGGGHPGWTVSTSAGARAGRSAWAGLAGRLAWPVPPPA